ncbi:tripartite motif-containing protein 2-like [Saccostrea cucullata]|uniref:tripartite motif-containing protein 2-like n=1 Tax=Saccostrea cuccullata TaxID=36930 RepID=UPI002ED5A1DE
MNLVNIHSQDLSELLGIKFNVVKYRKLPQNLALSFPTFTPGTIQGELRSLFGNISPGELTSESQGYSCPPVKQLLDKPKIINTIHTWYKISLYSLVHQSDEKLWTRGDSSTMKLYRVSKGSLLNSITTKSRSIPTDVAVTKKGHLVFIDPSDNTIYIVNNEKMEILIKFKKGKPRNICGTSSGDLLVVISSYENKGGSKLVRYFGSKEKQTIQFDGKGHPLYSSYSSDTTTKYVTENRNQDICVADEGAKAVVVVNLAGKLRFRYIGHTLSSNSRSYIPRGITTDSQSHILVADYHNHCVHILHQDGQFLCYLDCGLKYPYGLCVDTNDNLFVAQERNKQVKKIKYMQEI